MPREKKIYSSPVQNSVLELFESDQSFHAPSVLPYVPNETAIPLVNSIDFPKRDFWAQAAEFLG